MKSVMKQGSTLFLRGILALIALIILALCLFAVPAVAHDDAVRHPQNSLQYPFMIFVYGLASLVFVGLYQALRLLNLIDHNQAFSQVSVNTLRVIKFCALIFAALIVAGFLSIVAISHGTDEDFSGFTMLCLVLTLASSVVATFAAVLQKLLQNAIDIKTENDLTV